MGQRLNIEIVNNEKVLANCYYHWSGYTIASLLLTKQIIEYINENDVKKDVTGAIELLKSTGATFSKRSWKNSVEAGIISGKCKECKGRNYGLIGVHENDMKETRLWEEGRININIESKTFDFYCAKKKDYINDKDIWKKINILFFEIKGIKSKIKIPFDKIEDLISGIKKAENDYAGRFYFDCWCFQSIY